MSAAAPLYEIRSPEQTILYSVVASELERFLAEQRSAEHEVPRFVEWEFRAFLGCGVLSLGFLRVHCGSCGMDRVPLLPHPLMLTGVDMQHHSRDRPARPTSSVLAPLCGLHQSCQLQRLLHPRVTEIDSIFADQLLVEMPHIEVGVLLLVQTLHPLYLFQRNSLRTRMLSPVIQTAMAVLLDPATPSSHRPVRHAHDLGRLPPGQLPGHRFCYDFLYLQNPLHSRGRVLLFFHESSVV